MYNIITNGLIFFIAEEDLKRSQNHGQVQYNYEAPQNQETTVQQEDDEPYTPRPDLDVPVNMTLVRK